MNFFFFFSIRKNSIRIILVKIIIFKVNATKIYIKNNHFITIKYDTARIFIKVEYIFICVQISKMFFNQLLVTNQSGRNFNRAGQSLTTLSHIC